MHEVQVDARPYLLAYLYGRRERRACGYRSTYVVLHYIG